MTKNFIIFLLTLALQTTVVISGTENNSNLTHVSDRGARSLLKKYKKPISNACGAGLSHVLLAPIYKIRALSQSGHLTRFSLAVLKPPYPYLWNTVLLSAVAKGAIMTSKQELPSLLKRKTWYPSALVPFAPVFASVGVVCAVNGIHRVSISGQSGSHSIFYGKKFSTAIKDMIQKEGLKGWLKGVQPQILKTIPKYLGGLTLRDWIDFKLRVYNALDKEKAVQKPLSKEMRIAVNFLSSVTICALVNPFDIMRNAYFNSKENDISLLRMGKRLINQHGILKANMMGVHYNFFHQSGSFFLMLVAVDAFNSIIDEVTS